MVDGNTQCRDNRAYCNAADAAVVARRFLRTNAYASALHDVKCEPDSNAVVLRGRVSSFFYKQLAQELVRRADRGCPVINELHVEREKKQ